MKIHGLTDARVLPLRFQATAGQRSEMMQAEALLEGFAANHVLADKCLNPDFDSVIFSIEWKDALWDRFYTASPLRQRQSVEQYKIVKRV